MRMTRFKFLHCALIFVILCGIFFRFYSISTEYSWNDEHATLVAALKSHHQSFYDGAMYMQEHPPLGRWVQGIPTIFIDSNYDLLKILRPNFYAWQHLVFEPLRDTFVAMRVMNAIIGSFGVLFVFLISLKLYGLTPALWSSSLASVSFDMIGFSRQSGLWKIYSFTFILASIYFYITYIEADQNNKPLLKVASLLGTLFFLIFALGSRNFDPLFLVPILLISQFINFWEKKRGECILFAGSVFLCFWFVFFYLYPPEAKEFVKVLFNLPSFDRLIGFSFFEVIKNLLLRNSLLFSLSFIFISVLFIRFLLKNKEKYRTDFIGAVATDLKSQGLKQVIIIYFFIEFFGMTFTQQGAFPNYNLGLFGAVFILAGLILTRLSSNKWLLVTFFGLIIITLIQLTQGFPYNVWTYSNLGLDGPLYENSYQDRMLPAQVSDELRALGNPPLMANNMNLLLFYPGRRESIFVRGDSRCSPENLAIAKSQSFMVFIQGGNPADPYICELFADRLKLYKTFQKGGDVNGLFILT